MALKLWRWLGMTVFACAIVWVGIVRGHAMPSVTASSPLDLHIPPARRHLNEVAGRMSRTNDQVRQLEIRDSLIARYGAHAPPGLTIEIDSSVPPGVTTAMARLARGKWSRLGVHSSIPVIVAIVLDSATTAHGYPRRYASPFLNPISVFLPRAADSPCLSILRINESFSKMPVQVRGTVAQNLKAPETIDAVLGACAYIARFGPPGEHIKEWLQGGGWSFAHIAGWDSPSPAWTPRADARAYWFRDQLATIGDPNWQTRALIALSGLACIAGERGRCAEAAGTHIHSARADTAWANNVVSTQGASAYFLLFATKPSPLGADEGWLVSDMVRTLGDSAFRRFWSSDKPVAQAFSEASGRTLDDWVRDWARRTYGRIPTGPSLPATALAAGTAALLAGLGLAVLLERRRRVA